MGKRITTKRKHFNRNMIILWSVINSIIMAKAGITMLFDFSAINGVVNKRMHNELNPSKLSGTH